MSGAKVIVRMTLEIHCDDAWGDDCTLGQVRKQGKESALNVVNNLLSSETIPNIRVSAAKRCKVLGPVVVETVVT